MERDRMGAFQAEWETLQMVESGRSFLEWLIGLRIWKVILYVCVASGTRSSMERLNSRHLTARLT